MIVIRTIDDITYALDLDESIDYWINKRGFYEWGTTFTINKYVKKGMVSLDVGANIGCYALQMAKLVGDKGKVIAFEPMNYAFRKMKRNIELNPTFQQIIAEKVALSNVNERKLAKFTNSFPVDKAKKKRIDNNETVSFVMLDKYVEKNKIDRIDFIKIDTDGYELKVLRGARETLTLFHPIMIIEFGKPYLRRYEGTLEELIDFLVSLGYKFYTPIKEKEMSKTEVLDYCPENATRNVVCHTNKKENETNEVKI